MQTPLHPPKIAISVKMCHAELRASPLIDLSPGVHNFSLVRFAEPRIPCDANLRAFKGPSTGVYLNLTTTCLLEWCEFVLLIDMMKIKSKQHMHNTKSSSTRVTYNGPEEFVETVGAQKICCLVTVRFPLFS